MASTSTPEYGFVRARRKVPCVAVSDAICHLRHRLWLLLRRSRYMFVAGQISITLRFSSSLAAF